MIGIDRLRTGMDAQRSAWRTPFSPERLDQLAPLILALAVGAGLLVVIVTTPTASSDYGQWLMSSRYYLGQEVPEYRNISALPPLVPLLLAGIQLAVPDPLVALQVLNGMLLAALGMSFYLLGTLVINSRWAGVLALVAGLLATDRFLELFAFGGLLQVAAMAAMGITVAAFARAARGPGIVRRWWWAGTLAVAVAALSHTATGVLAIMVGVAVAGLAAARQRHVGWRPIAVAAAPLGVTLAAIGLYWLLILLPANADYLTNPASLAYRGPDRLFSPMLAHWPSIAILVLGTAALLAGGLRALLRRRIDGYVLLWAWVAVTWGALLSSMLSSAGTDYPRFATPLLAPLVVAAAAGAAWLLGTSASAVRTVMPRWSPNAVMAVVVLAGVLLSAPMVVGRHAGQAAFYDLRDAPSLAAAVTWMDARLGPSHAAVLTDVREGKWVEGLSGREALFSQPVRYAFRSTEWQRSVDADTVLRSSMGMTSGLIGAFFSDTALYQDRSAPAGLVVRANHGGELLDLLRLSSSVMVAGQEPIPANRLLPIRAVQSIAPRQASLRTVWGDPNGTLSLTQSATVFRDGSTMRLTQLSPGNTVEVVLRPAAGVSITTLTMAGREATVCFTRYGGSQPCLRIWVSQPDAALYERTDGALRMATSTSDRLDVLVTALTAGDAAVGLGLLDPSGIVEARDVGAALLYAPDPAYASRVRRLEALGFHESYAAGPYRVLLREFE